MKSKLRKETKNKRQYLILFILILCFSLVLQGNNNLFNEQDDKGFRNVISYSSDSYSVTSQWSRLWGGNETEYGHKVAVDSSGNVYLTGSTESFGMGNQDMILVKYDSSGLQQWNHTWGGIGRDCGCDVAVDSSQNIYVTGSSFTGESLDMILVKYDPSGVQQWNLTWGGSKDESGYGVIVDSLENVYITGNTHSFSVGSSDIFLVKFDSNGIQQWNRTWGESMNDFGLGVAVDSSDNIYLTGMTSNIPDVQGTCDVILVKYNSTGVQQWIRTWGGNEAEFGNEVVVDSSDNIYISGWTDSIPIEKGSSDMFLAKYNSTGVQLWNCTWGGSGRDHGYDVAIDSSDNVYIAGWHFDDMALVKYNSSGDQQWNRTWGGNNYECCYGMTIDTSDNIYLAGYTSSFGMGKYDMVLLKYIKSIFTLDSPNSYDFFGIAPPSFNISIFASNLNTTWYTLDGGIINITFSGLIGIINLTEWDKKGTGMIPIRFYANNTLGEEWYVEVSVFKDPDAPVITINSPILNQLCGIAPPSFDIQITEVYLQQKMYSLNGRPNITFTSETQFGQTEWNQIGNGTVLIKFYAIDKAGNVNSTEVIVRKDAYAPVITILSPLDHEIFGRLAPNFSLSIIEEDLDSFWYEIEGVSGTFPLSALTGTIDQDTWDDLPEGNFTITFFAIDKGGNIDSSEVKVRKDTSIPVKIIPFEPWIPIAGILLGILSTISIILYIKSKKS